MRKILLCTAKWLLISLSILGFGASVKAEDYGLVIAGVDVTSDNYTNLAALAPGNITLEKDGYFTYDPENKILTMCKVTIKADTDKNAIWNTKVDGLRIVVAGNNTLEATTWSALNIWRPTVLHGTGKLVVKSTKNHGIYLNRVSLTISDIVVEVSGGYGISGNSKGEKVEVNNATVTLNGTSGATVKLDGFNLVGCQIVEPAGAAFDADEHAIMAGGVNPKKVKIEPTPSTRYDLLIAGVKVTNKNCNDLSKMPYVNSAEVFTYDPNENVLTLKNVKMRVMSNANAIWNEVNGLKIVVVGENTLESTSWSSLNVWKPTVLHGTGKLVVSSMGNHGIFLRNASLTISDIVVEVSGRYGISGDSNSEKVEVNNATVTLNGTSGATVDLGGFDLVGCAIVEPAGAAFDADKHAIMAGGVNPKKVEIKPAALYALKIAGIDVTEANCTDLSGIAPGKVVVKTGGQFKYDPQNKILTLKGVTIESDTEIPIHNEGIEGLKIRFFNANTIKSANKEGILILKDTEFQGDGKLIVETPSEAGIRVNKNAQLTISTIIIEVSGQLGISGTNATSDESLKLNKTAITAKGTGNFAIGNFSTCILRDCRIASPAKGKWDDTQRTIVDATNTVAQEVKIVRSAPSPSPTPDPNAVEDAVFAGILVAPNPFSTVLRISNVERTGIRYSLFDAQGVSILSGELPEGEISLSTEALPAGLYLLQLQTPDGATKHWRVVK